MELDRMRSMSGGMSGGMGMGAMDGYGSLGRSRSPDPRADPSYGTRVAVEVSDLQERLAKSESELRKSQAELRLNQGDYERSHAEIEQMQEKVLKKIRSDFKVHIRERIRPIDFLTTSYNLQVEKSQGEIYRLRAKLESTQTENENMHDELDKMQQALNRSYTDRDKIATDIEKLRDDLERSQVFCKVFL